MGFVVSSIVDALGSAPQLVKRESNMIFEVDSGQIGRLDENELVILLNC
jgi:hypothetical protein